MKTHPTLGHIFVFGWKVGWVENQLNTKNAPCGACFSCSVGVLRGRGGGETAGEERVGISTSIQRNNKKK